MPVGMRTHCTSANANTIVSKPARASTTPINVSWPNARVTSTTPRYSSISSSPFHYRSALPREFHYSRCMVRMQVSRSRNSTHASSFFPVLSAYDRNCSRVEAQVQLRTDA